MATKNHSRTKRAGSPKGSSNRNTNSTNTLQTEKRTQSSSTNTNEEKKTGNNKWHITQTERDALKFVTENESQTNDKTQMSKKTNQGRKREKKVNWDEFIHLSLTWFVSAFAIAAVLVILSLEEQPTNLFHDVINRIDTLSLMFSLVLSAALEQMWNHKKSKMFQYTLAGELILVIGGLIWYLVCSIHEIQLKDPNLANTVNPVYIDRFWVHFVYILLSICCVFVGFFSRVFIEQEKD